jgi:hypothetical protein
MMKFLSIAALASAAVIAAAASAPVSAAAVTVHVPTNIRVGAATNATGARQFAPSVRLITVQSPSQEPKQRKWVCGPIVNWDGTPHCHWVPTPTYP